MKNLLAVSAFTGLLLSAHVSANCPATRPGKPPQLPNGSEASESAMFEAQRATRQYVASTEQYLDCRAALVGEVTYAHWLSKAKSAAASYNRELAKFRKQNDSLASN